jgi:nitrite reductase (NADH) small subunit
MTLAEKSKKAWHTICEQTDLVKDSGVSALIDTPDGYEEQVAIFYIPNAQNDSNDEQIFAVANYDPIGEANVLYRGIVGCIDNEPVISSPLYKQHFSLKTGRCLQEDVQIPIYDVRIENEEVQLLY